MDVVCDRTGACSASKCLAVDGNLTWHLHQRDSSVRHRQDDPSSIGPKPRRSPCTQTTQPTSTLSLPFTSRLFYERLTTTKRFEAAQGIYIGSLDPFFCAGPLCKDLNTFFRHCVPKRVIAESVMLKETNIVAIKKDIGDFFWNQHSHERASRTNPTWCLLTLTRTAIEYTQSKLIWAETRLTGHKSL